MTISNFSLGDCGFFAQLTEVLEPEKQCEADWSPSISDLQRKEVLDFDNTQETFSEFGLATASTVPGKVEATVWREKNSGSSTSTYSLEVDSDYQRGPSCAIPPDHASRSKVKTRSHHPRFPLNNGIGNVDQERIHVFSTSVLAAFHKMKQTPPSDRVLEELRESIPTNRIRRMITEIVNGENPEAVALGNGVTMEQVVLRAAVIKFDMMTRRNEARRGGNVQISEF